MVEIQKINVKEEFPAIYEKLSDDEKDLDEVRYFVVVNENYEDFDDEELDVFDPEDYNFLVYITERLSEILGKEKLKELYESLEKEDFIENFLVSEEDLYGVKSPLEEEELALNILKKAEKILKDNT